jgi:predicted SAM-dependent methyltransferase
MDSDTNDGTRPHPTRLHVGCGTQRLEGWINVDIRLSPQVDVVSDVTRGLHFLEANVIYAEHFLEHLTVPQAVGFLGECHRVLTHNGILRLSTPNLDWVWQTHYGFHGNDEQRMSMAVSLNRAFCGWGHKFLWNRSALDRLLLACGFTDIRWERYGESTREFLRDLERHETYGDSSDLPHVLIAEAGKGAKRPDELGIFTKYMRENLLDHIIA